MYMQYTVTQCNTYPEKHAGVGILTWPINKINIGHAFRRKVGLKLGKGRTLVVPCGQPIIINYVGLIKELDNSVWEWRDRYTGEVYARLVITGKVQRSNRYGQD